MDKKYYFLAGLHRSGNTLLSAILNQNPQIYSSGLSSVLGYMWDIESSKEYDQNYLRAKDKSPFDNVSSSIIKTYHNNVNKPIVIDREKSWAIPANLDLILKYIDSNPKIIFTERSILEILASFINIYGDKIFEFMKRDNWSYKYFLSERDNKCDYLMKSGGTIDRLLLSYNSLNSPEYKSFFHIVKYEDLVDKPQKTLNKVYDFLGMDTYIHDFNNIVKVENEDDFFANDPNNMHEIRPSIGKNNIDIENFFSDYVINKYGKAYWL